MARKDKVSLNELKGVNPPKSDKSKSNGSHPVNRTITFVDRKGKMWTTEMNLPENTTLETMRSIALTNISMMSKKTITKSDLVVLMQPKDLNDFTLEDIAEDGHIVIFDRTKLNILTGG
jgi:hypothetical protein